MPMFTPRKKHTTNQTPEKSSCCRNFITYEDYTF